MKANLPIQLLTALIWAGVGTTSVYWLIQFSGPPIVPMSVDSTAIQTAVMTDIPKTAIVQFLGGSAVSAEIPALSPAASASKRFELLGIVTEGSRGAALIAVNGQPARPFFVGSPLEESIYLKSVGKRFALLSASPEGPSVQRIDLPDDKR